MKFFDANFWIALFDADDSQHNKAVRLFDKEPGFAITEYCVLETATILTLKCGKETAIRFLTHIGDNADVTVVLSTPVFYDGTVRLFQEISDKKLSFVDMSLLVLSEFHDVITFDKALVRAIELQRK